MVAKPADLSALQLKVRTFCTERNWDQFHDLKELAVGLVTESAELLDLFRFRSKEEVEGFLKMAEKKTAIEDEIADVLFFLLRIADRYQIDFPTALENKIAKNALKYPVEKSYGSNLKYNETD